MTKAERLYTVTQVASMLGISEQQVLKKYPVIKIGNFIRIREEDIDFKN